MQSLKLFIKTYSEVSQNSQEKTCACISLLQPFIKKESLTQVFSCEFCEHLYKNTIFYRAS